MADSDLRREAVSLDEPLPWLLGFQSTSLQGQDGAMSMVVPRHILVSQVDMDPWARDPLSPEKLQCACYMGTLEVLGPQGRGACRPIVIQLTGHFRRLIESGCYCVLKPNVETTQSAFGSPGPSVFPHPGLYLLGLPFPPGCPGKASLAQKSVSDPQRLFQNAAEEKGKVWPGCWPARMISSPFYPDVFGDAAQDRHFLTQRGSGRMP